MNLAAIVVRRLVGHLLADRPLDDLRPVDLHLAITHRLAIIRLRGDTVTARDHLTVAAAQIHARATPSLSMR